MQDQVAEVMAKRPNIGEDGIGRMRARQHIFKLGVIDDNICVNLYFSGEELHRAINRKAKIAYGVRMQGFINRNIFWRTQN